MWFKLTSEEYDKLVKRVSECEARLNSLEIENSTLRNKVLRKIQLKRDEILEEDEPKSSKNLNTAMFPSVLR